MFTSFSGNTRRPRQVNLGGRKSHAFGGSTGSGAGSQAALDRAQQDRAQRQRERETLKAANTIQRVWRGHCSRRALADHLRQEWDTVEALPDTPYGSEEEAYGQLQRLLKFAKTRNQGDASRIQRFASRQMQTVQKLGLAAGGPWPSAYLRLQTITLAIIQRQMKISPSLESYAHFAATLHFLVAQIPAETSQHAHQLYQTLAHVVSVMTASGSADADSTLVKLLFETAMSPMSNVTGYTLNAYEAFGYSFLPLPVLSADTDSRFATAFRDLLADAINYKLLANSLATSLRESGLKAHPELADTASRLRLLGCFIYFHRFAHNFNSPEAYSVHKDFVAVVSLLLSSLPTNIIESSASEDTSDGTESDLANEFLRDQILSLVNQEGIGNLLSGSTQSPGTTEEEKVEEARQLANYALALLRFFPRRGDEIRMWLYLGPSDARAGKDTKTLPAIRYFWEATKRSSVFATISRDSRAAVDLLRPKTTRMDGSVTRPTQSPGVSQHSFWQAPRQEIDREAVIADEWRVILVFLELYTFVLKVTDDEEFFSGGQDVYSGDVRDNSLPLGQVKNLTTFLKNLGFTLYYNASDINAPEERDYSSTGLSFYNPQALEPQQAKPLEPSVGGVAGLSLDYVKGLVTGLVRMVYERDSRRKFLPADQWLMSSRLDMGGFIPAVVEEEESKNRIEEEDADDVVDDDEEELDDTPQLIGTGRTQAQQRLERLQRQQRKASRRRYLQAIAPRLEILQNMPFFISFATRVQIFREFVHLNMVGSIESLGKNLR
jgi:ubiquitin-protein ligase E3 C